MAEYIDRQAAVDALARLCKRVCQYSEKQRQYMCGACPLGDAFTVIEDDLPAADVRPAVRADWEDTPNPQWPAHSIRHCPCCGWSIPKSKLLAKDSSWNYCPNCGADMREES